MRKIPAYFLYTLIVFTFLYCNNFKQYTNKKTQYLNYPNNELIDLNAVAFHVNDSVTDIYLELKNEHLLYKRTDTSNSFYAEVKVICSLLAEENSNKLIDSSSFILFDTDESEIVAAKVLTNRFKLNAPFGRDYYLKIEAIDVNRKNISTTGFKINKHDHLSAQNFLLKQAGALAYKNTFTKHQTVLIVPANQFLNKLFVQCYTSEAKAALPPFSKKQNEEIQIKPDSSFKVFLSNGQFVVNTPARGFYFLRGSEDSDIGFTIHSYDAAFPSVSTVEEMITTCRYIMYKEEFDSCRKASDKKVAIDRFWLGLGGSHERAREILKKYYLRVKEANEQYSSYMEGWKTDRGMVSIVFGKPNNIYKSAKDEIWVYGLETNPSALRFVFKKTLSPFSDNDYVLERSDFYKEAYYQAVDYWRQGIVYSEKGLDR